MVNGVLWGLQARFRMGQGARAGIWSASLDFFSQRAGLIQALDVSELFLEVKLVVFLLFLR